MGTELDGFSGDLIQPGELDYEETRRAWNAMIAAILALALTLAACSRAETETPDPTASPTSSVAESPATDQGITGTFEANGRELFIDCIGQGSPTFVLEAGEGVPSDAMSGLKQLWLSAGPEGVGNSRTRYAARP